MTAVSQSLPRRLLDGESRTFFNHSEIGRFALYYSFEALDVATELFDLAFVELRRAFYILK